MGEARLAADIRGAVKQTKYEWVYLYAAVEPETGASVALQASRGPHVNTGTMSVFLKMLSDELGPRDHAVLIMDQAGWHKAKKLVVPENITILFLPPYSPELNPIERLWAYLRSHNLSNRAFDGYDHLLAAGARRGNNSHPSGSDRSVLATTSRLRKSGDPFQHSLLSTPKRNRPDGFSAGPACCFDARVPWPML